MIASRRAPRPMRPSSAIQVPPPSGPRWRSSSRMRVTYGSVTSNEPHERAPATPHISRAPRSSACRDARAREEARDDRAGALARGPVPELDRRRGERPPEERRDLVDPLRLEAEQRVRAELDRDGPLGRVTEREAADAECRGLLLHAAGVGEHEARGRLEPEELEVAERPGHGDVRHRAAADALDRARVRREEHRRRPRERRQAVERLAEQVGVVDERGAVQRDERVLAFGEPVGAPRLARARDAEMREQRVDHRVADAMNACLVDPLAREIRVRARRVRQQERAQVVREQPVVLLRHRRVEAAEARLDVRDRDVELRRGEGAGERRVDVAGDDDERRLPVEQHLLDADEGPGRLLGMRARADSEKDVGRGEAELADQDVGHLGVVVLAGMDDERVDVRRSDRGHDGRRLHEVRPGADDEADEGGHGGDGNGHTLRPVLALEIVFWAAVGALVWTHAAYPFAARALARVRTRPVRRSDDALPSVTLIVAAYNEESVIERRLANLRALDYPADRLELVVTSDASTDRTEALAEQAGVRVVRNPRGGKVAAQNNAVRQTSGEILAFSDANCTWQPHALRRLVRNFADPDVAYVCGRLNLESDDGRTKEGV